jgi:hypothetical protein
LSNLPSTNGKETSDRDNSLFVRQVRLEGLGARNQIQLVMLSNKSGQDRLYQFPYSRNEIRQQHAGSGGTNAGKTLRPEGQRSEEAVGTRPFAVTAGIQ